MRTIPAMKRVTYCKSSRIACYIFALSAWIMASTVFYVFWTNSTNPTSPVSLQLLNNDVLDNSSMTVVDFKSINLTAEPSIVVLLVVCDRTQLIMDTLNNLISVRSVTRSKFRDRYYGNLTIEQMVQLPIVVSQDCGNTQTSELVETMMRMHDGIVHQKYPHWETRAWNNLGERRMQGYYRIARHYHWAIEQAFLRFPKLDYMIIVEDDLRFSLDFFEYLLALAPMLSNDSNTFCISAWNDNGKMEQINSSAPSLLYRTDFFPGLGWMLKKSSWDRIKSEWPRAFWDDWLRGVLVRNRLQCVRPEIPRTSTVGVKGVSKGQFYKQHLKYIEHFKAYNPFFESQDKVIRWLESEQYAQNYLELVYNQSIEIQPIAMHNIEPMANNSMAQSFRIIYYTRKEFITYAGMFNLMSDFKSGVARTAYQGIVTCLFRGHRLYLAPPHPHKTYLADWD